jgi:superfamily II helicase
MCNVQTYFRSEPDSILKLSEWAKYFVYNLKNLTEMGFRHNPNAGANVFTYCGFCKSYRWHLWYARMSYRTEEIIVCDTCNNHLADEKLRTF